jgi:hypothetical protein
MTGATVARAMVLGVFAGATSCGPSENAAPTASAVAAAPTPLVPAPASASVEIEDELSTRPVELLKLTLTSGVENKQPKDVLTSAKPKERVYAHVVVRNRSGRERKIHVAFLVNGDTRSEVDLNVGNAWSWRTWAYNTLNAKDVKGTVRVEITDDEGNAVGEAELPIR